MKKKAAYKMGSGKGGAHISKTRYSEEEGFSARPGPKTPDRKQKHKRTGRLKGQLL